MNDCLLMKYAIPFSLSLSVNRLSIHIMLETIPGISLSPNLFQAATYRDLVLGQHWHLRLLDLLGTLKRFHERKIDFEL